MAQENIPVYAQGTAGKQRLHCSARNWFGLTERIEQRSKVLAQVNGNRLVIRSSGPGQAMFLVDERRLLQVLSNLLTNAASYCRSGVIELTCRIEQVKASDDWSLSFAVSDTGPGIAPEEMEWGEDEPHATLRPSGIEAVAISVAPTAVASEPAQRLSRYGGSGC